MLAASRLQHNLGSVFHLARTDGISFKVHHNKRVFIVDLTPTDEVYIHNNTGRKHVPGNRAHPRPVLRMENCPECNHIVVAKICINKLCKTNKRSSSA